MGNRSPVDDTISLVSYLDANFENLSNQEIKRLIGQLSSKLADIKTDAVQKENDLNSVHLEMQRLEEANCENLTKPGLREHHYFQFSDDQGLF